jgi:hypothetical protein
VNDLSIVEQTPGVFRLTDAGALISPQDTCRSVDPHTVVCVAKRLIASLGDGNDRATISALAGQLPSAREQLPKASIELGSGNDTASLATTGPGGRTRGSDFTTDGRFRGTYAADGSSGDDVISGSDDGDILKGGADNDRITGGDGDDVVAGGTGDDRLSGGSGADFVLGSDLDAFDSGQAQPPDRDSLEGGPGPDLLAGGPGPDAIAGGPDHDTLLYAPSLISSRQAPERVTVSFDGRGNDGPPGEHDNVTPDVESSLSVGSGNFSLAGTVVLERGAYAVAGGSSARATVQLFSSRGTRGGQSGLFYGSSFNVHPAPHHGAVTEVRLPGQSLRSCPKGSNHPRARTARRRGLWGNAKGRFRTHGRYGAATVRGTLWLTVDRCDGTLVQVSRGVVQVRDFAKHRTVTVRAGQQYLARAPSH